MVRTIITSIIEKFQKRIQESRYRRVLKRTAGLLRGKDDSVSFVRNLRKEWD